MLVTSLNIIANKVSYMVLTGFGLNQVATVEVTDDNGLISWTTTFLPGRTDSRIGLKLTAVNTSTTHPRSGNITATLKSSGGAVLWHEGAIGIPYVED